LSLLEKISSPAELKRLSLKGLNQLSGEIRDFLIESVSKTGGHLASNLGIVEITLALHYCLNSPEDKILWDVGHQAYVHKILTGRRDAFAKLRKLNGLSGFPKKGESPHDFFDTGHSSTSISTALGLAKSRDLNGESYKIAAITGDGSMTGGLMYEAMNNAGSSNTDMMVILNDNQMSISENVGALSRHLNEIRTNPKYLGAKRSVGKILYNIPVVGEDIGKFVEKTKDSVRYLLVPGVMFEEMGFKYIGPVDGHNIKELITVFNRVKEMKGPVIVHVYTKKGKGYSFAEEYPGKFHGIDKFDVETGRPLKTKIWDSYSDVAGKTLLKLAKENERIVAISAAMPEGCGLNDFAKQLPSRFFDVGIAEGHAATFASGLAAGGHIPVFAVYSTFLQRSYDQLMHDVCLQNLHVVFMVDRAGIVGADGETHQGIYDISFLCHMPNMVVMAPKNKKEFKAMIEFACNHDGPVALRYPRGSASMVYGKADNLIELGKGEILEQGKDVALVCLGSMMDNVSDLYTMLKAEGYGPTLINARFAKPFDMDIAEMLSEYKYVFTFEDNEITAGFGARVLEAFSQIGAFPEHFHKFGFPDEFIPQGSREELFDKYGLSAAKMLETIMKITEGNSYVRRYSS